MLHYTQMTTISEVVIMKHLYSTVSYLNISICIGISEL